MAVLGKVAAGVESFGPDPCPFPVARQRPACGVPCVHPQATLRCHASWGASEQRQGSRTPGKAAGTGRTSTRNASRCGRRSNGGAHCSFDKPRRRRRPLNRKHHGRLGELADNPYGRAQNGCRVRCNYEKDNLRISDSHCDIPTDPQKLPEANSLHFPVRHVCHARQRIENIQFESPPSQLASVFRSLNLGSADHTGGGFRAGHGCD